MREWKYTLRLADLFHNEALTFTERRDKIVARMKRQPWWKEFADESFTTWDIADGLATANDEDEWDEYWDLFYDWADDMRIWVQTRSAGVAV